MIWLFFLITLAVLVVGSYTDFKTREVPDWVNYGLIFTGVGLHAILSAVSYSWMPLLSSGIGLGIGIGVAFAMYYLGQWGGGDAKMMMGLGAMIGFDLSGMFFLSFLINVFFLGAVYGLCYGAVLAVRNRKAFGKTFDRIRNKIPVFFRRLILAVIFLVFIIAIIIFVLNRLNLFLIYIFSLVLILIALYYLYLFAKSVERCCMLKYVNPSKLTEGDWIVKDFRHKGKYICGPKDLGISKKQIKMLKRLNVRKILVKDGIPFVPSFLIAFVFSYFFGNILAPIFSVL